MTNLFKDSLMQENFDRQGYLVLPFLSDQELNGLKTLYDETINPELISGLYESSRKNSLETNRIIHASIQAMMKDPAEKLFADATLYGGTFMVKSGQQSEVLPLHQDWSVVEEDKFRTVFIWCPLQDVNASNGCIFLVEGSHLYFDQLRSGSYPSNRYILPLAANKFVKDIALKAGEAIIYSDKIFHGSHANNSGQDRIVATGRVMDKAAKLVYFHQTTKTEVGVFPASSDFYLQHIDLIAKGQMPGNISPLYTKEYRHTEITADQLAEKILESYSGTDKKSSMQCQLFKNDILQSAFEKNGYVVIDLLDANKVMQLKDFYGAVKNSTGNAYGFHVSLDDPDPGKIKTISAFIKDTVQSGVDQYFRDYQIFTTSFVVKENNPIGVVPPHQDWTFVDENRYWSATIWCPLLDVDFNNGTLGLIRGSHLFYDHVRPSPSNAYGPPFKQQVDIIFPYFDFPELKAGQAIVFNNKTIHGSPPNYSGNTRLAVGVGITHRHAELLHYYMLPGKNEEQIEGYAVDPGFFFHYNNAKLSALYDRGEKPADLPVTAVIRYTARQYSNDELISLMENAGNIRNPDWHMSPIVQQQPETEEPVHNNGKEHSKLPFWKVYTPINIFREVRYRLFKR